MRYNNLLKCTASEDILNIPLEACRTSKDFKRVVSSAKVYRNNKMEQKIATVGDLLRLGSSGVQSFLLQYGRSSEYLELNQEMNEILADFGLKFADGNFTVGDVRVSRLDLTDKEFQFLNHAHCETLDDLIVFNKIRLESLKQCSGSKVDLDKIENAVEDYGLKIEGFVRKRSPNSAFPLHNYKQFLSEKTLKAIEEKCSQDNENVLLRPVKVLSLSDILLSRLYGAGINNIGQLVKKCQKIKTKIITSNMIVITRELAKLGLKLDGFDYEICNGQVVRKSKAFNNVKVPEVIPVQNLASLEDSKLDKIKAMTLREFGIDERIAEICEKKGIVYVEDYLKLDTLQIIALADKNASFVSTYLRESFGKYGFEPKSNLKCSNVFEFSKVDKFLKTKPSAEKIDQFIHMPLKDVGFQEEAAGILQTNDINNIVDLTKMTRPEVEALFTRHISWVLTKLLTTFGMHFHTDSQSRTLNKKVVEESVDEIKKLPVEKRKSLYLRDVGVDDNLARMFEQAFDAKTIGDVCNLSFHEIAVGIDSYRARVIKGLMGYYGLELKQKSSNQSTSEPGEEE